MNLWKQSYRAALQAKLLTQQLALLHQQQVNVHNWLANVQANDQAQAAAAEAARRAAEQARIAAEQQRQTELAEAMRLQKEQAEILAREQARLAAMAETQRMAGERAVFEEQAKIKREAEKARKAKESAEIVARYEAMVATFESWEAARTSRPYPVSGSAATAGPVFTLAAGRLATGATTNEAVRITLQTAVAAVISAGSTIIVGFAALLYPSTLGDGESRQLNVPLSDLVPDDLHFWKLSLSEYEPDSLHALSIPLSDLTPYDLQDLYAAARSNSRVSLPIAVGARRVQNTTEFFVAASNGTSVPGKLPVQLATFDPSLGVYRSYDPDAKSNGITWTPIVRPNNASTALPASRSNIAIYDGTTLTALEGRTDTFPEFDLYTFGGFVTVFPSDSGLPPIFTMFKDRRDDPGVASGYGVTASAIWLGAAATPQGAPIPTQIADKLRGREFSSFRAFRKAFWKAVGNDQALFEQFTPFSKFDIKNGLSPTAPRSEQVGGKTKLDIHHVVPIAEGGSVYDLDNLRVLTPKRHIETHSEMRKQKNEIQE